MNKEIKAATAKDFVASGYTVEPTCNGGFVMFRGNRESFSPIKSDVSAFSDSADLLDYLREGHGAFDGGAE